MTDSEKLIEVHTMAMQCMNTTYMYGGIAYRPNDNWSFEFNDVDYANGQCQHSKIFHFIKNIFLSRWAILRTEYSLDYWKGIMLHEIAHAIDIERRGGSSHDEVWFDIADSIGGTTNTVTVPTWLYPFRDKYIRSCSSCGSEAPLKEKPQNESSCGKCYPEGFSFDHIHDIKLNPNYIAE